METLTSVTNTVNGIVWGWPMLILILGTGFYLMIGLRFMPIRNSSIRKTTTTRSRLIRPRSTSGSNRSTLQRSASALPVDPLPDLF